MTIGADPISVGRYHRAAARLVNPERAFTSHRGATMTKAPRHPIHCTIIPPHMLDQIQSSGDPAQSRAAQATLEQDAAMRELRAATAAEPKPAPPEGIPAVPPTKTRSIFDAQHRRRLPGIPVRSEAGAPTGDADA